MGSAISYFRRYSLSSILGLVTDKDLDATGTQTTKTPEPTKPTLTSEQLMRLIGAINAGKTDASGAKISVEWALNEYTLTTEQLNTLNQLKTA